MNLDFAMINLSWRCDNSILGNDACPYCWVSQTNLDRNIVLEKTLDQWLTALQRHFQPHTTFDFVGGEPTLVPGFHGFLNKLSQHYRWAITSNMGGDRWHKFYTDRLMSCVSWTASYHHHGNDSLKEFIFKCQKINEHYPVSVNLVQHDSYDFQKAHETIQKSNLRAVISPFELVDDLNTAGEKPLTCNGGQSHVVIDPSGNMYKCLAQLRRVDRNRWIFANLFSDKIRWATKRAICFLPCDQYYVLDRLHSTKDMWGLDVRELEIPANISLEEYKKSFEVLL